MGKLSVKDTKHVALLAKLDLSDDETDKFTKQLSSVLDYVSELDSVDIKNVEPTAQPTNLENVLRRDEVKPENCLTVDEALSNTENTQNGFITVKQILHNEN